MSWLKRLAHNLRGFFKKPSDGLDSLLRFTDLSVQSLSGEDWFHRRYQIRRHNIDAFLWPSIIAGALIAGMPSLGPRLLAGLAVAVAAFFFFLRAQRWTASRAVGWDLWVQALFVLAVCAVTLTGGRQVPDGFGVYLHLLVPLAGLSALSISAAAWLAPGCFGVLVNGSQYGTFLPKTELFQSFNKRLESGFPATVQAAILVITRPLRLLWPPAIAVMAARPGYVILAGVITLAASWLVWTMAGLNERLDEISTQLSARLFRNTALVISLLIIALGVGRIFDVTYVTTVLDSASGWQILLYLVFGYAIAFWSDYWIDRISGEEMLKVVGHNESHSIQLAYKIDLAEDQRTDVPVAGRVLRLHGIGRFLVVCEGAVELTDASGWTPMWVKSRCPAFHSWTYADFFERLQACADSQGRARPLARQIQARLLQFQSLNALVFAILLGAGIWLLSKETQVALAEATVQQPPELTLATLLTKSEDTAKPPIFIAASGGGTRAALFTAAVLEGIWKGQGGKQLVLGSGVSGGGAALAYYGSNRKELIAGKDWDLYFRRISEPFIRDVLDRASEWRMMTGDRLGTLLQESFRRRWELNSNRQTLGQIEDFGLIFNTTLAGHYRDDGKGQGSLAERASEHMRDHRSSLAGGRLILTNLNIRDAFKDSNLPYRQQILLPVVVDSPQMELVKAAALNANFPPVFSNAPVDVDGRTRYWVTDGGAADNRGVEMLMYAVRQMLAANPKALPKGALIVVADAGAESDSFSQDRGIGSATGAGSVFAMHLSAEILRDINRIEPNVKLIYVRMPKILRASGSFGTHWMLQPNIRVNDPNPTDKSLSTISKIKEWWAGKSIEGSEAIVMLRALYGGQPEKGLGTTGQEVLGWLKESEEYRGDWKAVQEWLAAQH